MITNPQNVATHSVIKVLMAETPAKDVQSVKKALSESSEILFTIEAVSDRKSALERFLKGGIDVVIMDQNILNSQGLDVLSSWSKTAPTAPIVILSDKEDKNFLSEAIRRGAKDYLTKVEMSGPLLSRVLVYAIERKENEIKMKSLANMGLDFVSLVSHELRAPLAITKEGVNLVLDKILGKTNQKQQQVLTTARKNIDRLDQIIMNILDISKIEAGRIALKKQWVDLADMVKRVAGSFDARIKEKNLTLKVSATSEKIEVLADRDRLYQVLTNLVNNAVKFTNAGTIEIVITVKENKIECSISDTGIGIAKENQCRVFGKFQQLAWEEGGGEKGMGLGLAISKAIIELHHGQISVESQLGKGSRFTFNLPKERLIKSNRK